MNISNKYVIAHKGLSIGAHKFTFDVDKHLFDTFEGSEIHDGQVTVEVSLEKQTNNVMTLDFHIEGLVKVPCDRCLDDCEVPVEYDGTLVVRYSETEQESDGEILWISPSETEICIGQYIYESICLSLPYQKVHADMKDCNNDMISRFAIVSQEEFDTLIEKKEETPAEGSPFEKLKELKDKMSK